MKTNEKKSVKNKRWHWIPGFIRHDFMRKFFAVIFAIIISVTVYYNKKMEDVTKTIGNVRVNLTLEEGYVWNYEDKPEVMISVTGPNKLLNELTSEHFVVNASVGKTEFDTQKLTLTTDNIRCLHPQKSMVTSMDVVRPVSIPLDFDRYSRKEVKIEAEKQLCLDELPPGYHVGKVEILDGGSVEVRGPERLVGSLKSIKTEPVTLRNQVSDFIATAKLIAPEGVALNQDSARIKIELYREITKTFQCPVQLLVSNETETFIQAEPQEVQVRVRGAVNRQGKLGLGLNGINAYVDLSEYEPGVYDSVPVKCAFDESGFRFVEAVPAVVKVRIVRNRKDSVPGGGTPADSAKQPEEAGKSAP